MIAEIIGSDGRVHYRRHPNYPLVKEAEKILGYSVRLVEKETVEHDPYKTGDDDAPEQIKDRNGEVVLVKCRRCGQAEVELSQSCGKP